MACLNIIWDIDFFSKIFLHYSLHGNAKLSISSTVYNELIIDNRAIPRDFLLIQRFLFIYFFLCCLKVLLGSSRRKRRNKINKIKKGAYYIPRREKEFGFLGNSCFSLFFPKTKCNIRNRAAGWKPKTNNPFLSAVHLFWPAAKQLESPPKLSNGSSPVRPWHCNFDGL